MKGRMRVEGKHTKGRRIVGMIDDTCNREEFI